MTGGPARNRVGNNGRSLALLFAATGLWGASSALIAHIGADGFLAAPVAAGGGAALLGFALLTGGNPWRDFRAAPGLFLRLGVLEVLNLALYVAALKIGPLPVVVALHLTAPVLLIVDRIVRGRRRLTVTVGLELLLVAVAIGLVAGHPPGGSALAPAIAGCLLAVASAGCVAALITLVVRESAGRPAVTAAGLQLATAAVLGTPLLGLAVTIWPAPAATDFAALAAIGALLLGPGFACYWPALRDRDEVTAGLVGLNEAVTASLLGALLVGSDITVATLSAGALVLLAVAVEVWNN